MEKRYLNKLTPSEIDAFKRGITIAFITTTVRESVEQVYKQNPELAHIKVDPNELATRIIISTYTKLKLPIPTMEEAMINADVIKLVGQEMVNITQTNKALFNTKYAQEQQSPTSTPPKFKNEVSKQPIRPEHYDSEQSRKSGMFKLSKKEREELR